jgi:hypothetical protein
VLQITNPRLRRLYDYWCERRRGRRYPGRSDVDPLDLTFLLGNLILVDVIAGEPLTFYIRLHGTNLSERSGYELTGKMLSDLPVGEYRAQATASFTTVATTGEPLHGHRDRILDGKLRQYEALILPLSKEGNRVDMLMVGMIYADEREP